MSILFTFLVILLSSTLAYAQVLTKVGSYAFTCPRAESVVTSTVRSAYGDDVTIAPALLRLHFHDCFVNGCDASILISGVGTEKTAQANLLLRGFDVIEDAKTQIEAICPGVVSCADILALAARDSVLLTTGLGWSVPTGRLDGKVSLASATSSLPGFADSVAVQKDKFTAKGLNTQDLVTLVGGHTIGTAACRLFSYRLQNFTANGGPDPSISLAFLTQLRALCPPGGDGTRRVALDDRSEGKFDNSFFANLRDGKGVLESDQVIWTDASTKTFVQRFLGLSGLLGLTFSVEFGKSMVKMGNIELKTAANGEIRKVCNAIN